MEKHEEEESGGLLLFQEVQGAETGASPEKGGVAFGIAHQAQ